MGSYADVANLREWQTWQPAVSAAFIELHVSALEEVRGLPLVGSRWWIYVVSFLLCVNPVEDNFSNEVAWMWW